MDNNYDELYVQLREYLARQQPSTEEERDLLIERFINHYNKTHTERRATYSLSPSANAGADELLRLARSTSDPRLAVEYAKRALKMEPENLSAQIIIAKHNSETPDELLEKLREITGRASVSMKQKGYFKNDVLGRFWYKAETRQYLLLLKEVISLLTVCGKLKAAADMCNYMLRLCAEDTPGARFYLFNIYAFLEDEKSAMELFERFPDNDPLVLMSLSVMYYKLDNLTESEKYLLRLRRYNKAAGQFFNVLAKGDLSEYMTDGSSDYSRTPINELVDGYPFYNFLLASVPTYVNWADDMLGSLR